MVMTRSIKLSVGIAARNEEQNIARCIKSVYELADEIVVIDATSTDKTVSIARSFGSKVKVFVEKHVSMFHINKQKALEKARGEWIVQLDADEEVTDNLRDEISQIVSSKLEARSSKTPVAFSIPRLNYFLGKPLRKGGQYPDYTIRLYRNGAAKFPCESIHEQVTVQGEIGFLKNPINHYPYKTFTDYIAKWDRYCDLEAQNLYDRKIKLTFWLFLEYFLVKPKTWFVVTYFRHKGFMDGFPGYIFSLFSSMRFLLIYIKLYEKNNK
jgi:glycosyltransferase involved in cell wall biosynthesis